MIKLNRSPRSNEELIQLIDQLIEYNKEVRYDLFTIAPMLVYTNINNFLEKFINSRLTEVKTNVEDKEKCKNIISEIIKKLNYFEEQIKSDEVEDRKQEKILQLFHGYDTYLDEILKYFKTEHTEPEELGVNIEPSDLQQSDIEQVDEVPSAVPHVNTKYSEFDEEEEYDEEEYDSSEIMSKELINDFTTIKDLKNMSYKEVFTDDDELRQKQDLLRYRNGIIEQMKEFHNMNPLKKKLLSKKLVATYVIEEYYNYVLRVAKSMDIDKVFRFKGDYPYEALKQLRMKARASKLESTEKYTYDYGIIYYWIFKDAIIFRTI